jgi:hypothetical protein
MSKRPRIRGRGADVYLGGDSTEQADLQAGALERVKSSKKGAGKKTLEPGPEAGESLCIFESVRKAAASCILAQEELANQAIAVQERSASWARETPWAPWFEAQTSLARQFVEQSASAARRLWQIPEGSRH